MMNNTRFNWLLFSIGLLVVADTTLTCMLTELELAQEVNPIALLFPSLSVFFYTKVLCSISGLLYIYSRTKRMFLIPGKYVAPMYLLSGSYTLLVAYLTMIAVTGPFQLELVQWMSTQHYLADLF